MVIIRLTRVGTRNRPYYRVVAIDHRDKRDGRARPSSHERRKGATRFHRNALMTWPKVRISLAAASANSRLL